jgi:tyrosyl-tRNA synthetase
VGITEPPADMFRKLMNMSDTLVWRYYELLTDLSLDEIDRIRADKDPLSAKKDLASRIVAEFHSRADADRVSSAWGGLPPIESLEHYPCTDARLNRILVQAKFVASVTEADKIIKTANSVAIFRVSQQEEVRVSAPSQRLESGHYIMRVGKKYRHVILESEP